MGTVYHVGTSGWHYDEWGHGLFYPQELPKSRWLRFYAQRFDTVEINNTFYRLPTEEVPKSWGEQAPEGFRFAMKASRRITHERRLRDCEEYLDIFLSRVRAVGEGHIGPVLYQLPPYMRRDDGLLEGFLKLLPRDMLHAFEFRHRSWFDPQALELLGRYGAGLCVHDMPAAECPITVTASFAYFRLHGLGGATEGEYSDDELRRWEKDIRDAAGGLEQAFIYFDNDEEGRALSNAETLRGLLSQSMKD